MVSGSPNGGLAGSLSVRGPGRPDGAEEVALVRLARLGFARGAAGPGHVHPRLAARRGEARRAALAWIPAQVLGVHEARRLVGEARLRRQHVALELLDERRPALGLALEDDLVEGLREGALRSLTMFCIEGVHVGDTGASELADALDRGAMPRLQGLGLVQAAIKDATLAILTPALRRRPALERLYLDRNPITAEGVKALVAGFARLHTLYISGGRSITSDGRDSLVAALAGGALPKLVRLKVEGFGEVAPRLGCGWRLAMSREDPSLWEITHPPPGGSRAPFVLDIHPRWAAVPSPVLPS